MRKFTLHITSFKCTIRLKWRLAIKMLKCTGIYGMVVLGATKESTSGGGGRGGGGGGVYKSYFIVYCCANSQTARLSYNAFISYLVLQ